MKRERVERRLWGEVVRSLPQPLGHILVGELDLAVGRARVGELFPAVGVVQVAPHPLELGRDVVVPVLLRDHLRKKISFINKLN